MLSAHFVLSAVSAVSQVAAFLLRGIYGPKDYLGWDPVKGPPPLEGHTDENGPISVFRALRHIFFAF